MSTRDQLQVKALASRIRILVSVRECRPLPVLLYGQEASVRLDYSLKSLKQKKNERTDQSDKAEARNGVSGNPHPESAALNDGIPFPRRQVFLTVSASCKRPKTDEQTNQK